MNNHSDFELVTSSARCKWRRFAASAVLLAASVHAAACSSTSSSPGSNGDGGSEAGEDATTGDDSMAPGDGATPQDSSTPVSDASMTSNDGATNDGSMASNDASPEGSASDAGVANDASDGSVASDASDSGTPRCPAGLGDAGVGGCAVLGATLSGSGNLAHYFFDLPGGSSGTDMTGATVTATFIAPNATGGQIQTWLQNASSYALDAVSGFTALSTLTSSWTTITLTTSGSTVTNEGRIGIDIEPGSSSSFEQPATVVYLASVIVRMPGDAAAPVGPYTFPNAGSVTQCVSDGGACPVMYTSNLFLDVGTYDTNIPASLTWLPQ